MYVLIYVSQHGYPGYAQGTMEEINDHVTEAIHSGQIDPNDWEINMLHIEDGMLKPINNWDIQHTPRIVIS